MVLKRPFIILKFWEAPSNLSKFIYSEKATKFCEISAVDYTGQIYGRNFAKFSGLLRIYELYPQARNSITHLTLGIIYIQPALHNIHTSFRVFLNLKVFLLWALCLWSLDLSDISELPSPPPPVPPPPATCLAFSPLVTEMKHATLFGSWVWFYKKMVIFWTFGAHTI